MQHIFICCSWMDLAVKISLLKIFNNEVWFDTGDSRVPTPRQLIIFHKCAGCGADIQIKEDH